MAMKEIDFEGSNPNVKKKRRVKHPEFEKELLKFVLERESDGVSGYMVLEKAERLRVSHDREDHDLKISKGWLQSFKKRNNFKSRALTGESGSLCIEDVQAAKSELRSLIEQ